MTASPRQPSVPSAPGLATSRSTTQSSSTPADWLSAAADGDAEAIGQACRAFREGDRRARADWHAYHLIGDVMRSSELASPPARDADFLATFRERLAAEPVVLAPAAARRSTRWSAPWVGPWRAPAAALASAAGVAVVAGVLVMSRSGGEGSGASAVPFAAAPTSPGATPTLVRDGVIRDARIEEFMRLHQGSAGGLSLPRADVRQVDVIVAPAPGR
jgi:sigma-E factor negative regulatory protein RseA